MPTRRADSYGWNAAAARYVDARGRFVSRRAVRAAIDVALDSAGDMMYAATLQLREGTLTVAQWRTIMRQEIKNVHLYNASAAKGGWAQMTARDYGIVGQRVGREYAYLDRFARQLRNPRFPRDGRILQRARMYAQAGRRTYHAVERDVQRAAGRTQERNILNSGRERCNECHDMTEMDWVPIGALIPVGGRTCLSMCKCMIDYR